MNQNLREYLNALKSGYWRQSRLSLRRKHTFLLYDEEEKRQKEGYYTSYCCLGVACELFRQATGEGEWMEEIGTVSSFKVGDEEYHGILPVEVADWLGIPKEMRYYTDKKGQRVNLILTDGELATISNDIKRRGLPAIGEMIEKKYYGVIRE